MCLIFCQGSSFIIYCWYYINSILNRHTKNLGTYFTNCTPECYRQLCDTKKEVKWVTRLTSLRGSPREIWSWSSFCSSFRAPIDCWFLAKSESSLSPASVKYLEKCSQLRLLAGNSSWESAHILRQSIRSLYLLIFRALNAVISLKLNVRILLWFLCADKKLNCTLFLAS